MKCKYCCEEKTKNHHCSRDAIYAKAWHDAELAIRETAESIALRMEGHHGNNEIRDL